MNEDTVRSILRQLNETSSDIQASGVISKEGLVIAAIVPQWLNEDRLGAMSAAILSIGKRTTGDLVRGSFEQLLIKSPRGDVLMLCAGPEAVLSVVARADTEFGAIYENARRAAISVAAALDPAPIGRALSDHGSMFPPRYFVASASERMDRLQNY